VIQPAPTIATILHGRVLAADGTPVSGGTVLVALPQASKIRIRNGNLEVDDPLTPRAMTGTDGRYNLPQPQGKFILQVIAGAGYGLVNQDAVANNADIHLVEWGR